MAVVLIAEDDDDVRTVLHRIFVRAGFTVLTEPDGAAALQRTLLERPDIVLTDLDMPGMNGLELCHAIRRADDIRDVPVAILSGGIQRDDPRLNETQLCGTLLKPFSSADIVAAVQRLLDAGPHRHTAGTPCSPKPGPDLAP
jgi:CheY-like chemotaxis protein